MEELITRYAKVPKNARIAGGVVLLVGIWGLFFWAIYDSQRMELQRLSDEFEKVSGERSTQLAQVKSLALKEAQLNVLKDEFATARAMLPDTADIPQFLSQLGNTGREAGLSIDRFAPQGEQFKDFIAEISFEMSVMGSYHEIAMFIDQVGKLDRIINVADITMKTPKTKEDKVVVASTLSVKTYRFLSDEERKAAEANAKAGAKKK